MIPVQMRLELRRCLVWQMISRSGTLYAYDDAVAIVLRPKCRSCAYACVAFCNRFCVNRGSAASIKMGTCNIIISSAMTRSIYLLCERNYMLLL